MGYLIGLDEENPRQAYACKRVNMSQLGLHETDDLEEWIKNNPEVLGDKLKIVTTQFDKWISEYGKSNKRLDVLALSDTGRLVVVELKRGKDSQIHLQALTYAALSSSFTEESLVRAHVEWLNKDPARGQHISEESARNELISWLAPSEDGTPREALDVNLFAYPKIVLVAEEFDSVTLTTVQWLQGLAGELDIECYRYEVFEVSGPCVTDTGVSRGSAGRRVVYFNRFYPVEDIEGRRLRASLNQEVVDKIRDSEQRTVSARAVKRIYEQGLIAGGSKIKVDFSTVVDKDYLDKVEAVLERDRREFVNGSVTWVCDPTRPLRWSRHPDGKYSPGALYKAICHEAGITPRSNVRATKAFKFNELDLAEIADGLGS